MFETLITKGLLTAAKIGLVKHSGEIMAAGKTVADKALVAAEAAAPLVAPGLVAGVAGGAIAHAVSDDPETRAVTGALVGGVGGAAAGFFTGGACKFPHQWGSWSHYWRSHWSSRVLELLIERMC